MKKILAATLFGMPVMTSAAVDTTSSSYQYGKYVGYAFMAILAILIVRKLFK